MNEDIHNAGADVQQLGKEAFENGLDYAVGIGRFANTLHGPPCKEHTALLTAWYRGWTTAKLQASEAEITLADKNERRAR